MRQQLVEISVKGEVDPASMVEMDDVTVTADRGVTRLRLRVRDDSALYGLLGRLENARLEVLAVYPIPEAPPSSDGSFTR